MTLIQACVLGAIGVMLVLLVWGRIPPAVTFFSVAVGFYLTGLISLDDTLRQFTNTGLITVLLLMLVSVALDKSRLLELVADRLTRGPYRWALLKVVGVTAAISAFLNNTAVVASLLGPLRSGPHHPPSRLLLAMTYAATLGGVLTLIGTSTNLLVNSFLIGQKLPGLSLMSLMPVGLALLALSVVAMLLFYPRLMPSRKTSSDSFADYFLEAEIQPGSKLIGRSVADNGLRHLGHLFLAEIVRDGRLIAPVEPSETLHAGDVLIFSGDIRRLDLLAGFDGLHTYGHKAGLPMENLVEVLITGNSTLVNRTIKETDFRSRFDAAVIAVRRGRDTLGGPIGAIPLEVGDTLVLAVGPDFEKRNNLARNFIIISRPAVAKFTDARKSIGCLIGFALVVLGSALGWFDFIKGLGVLLAAYLVFGFVSLAELRRNAPYSLVFIIGSALIISKVMFDTGTAQLLASGVLTLSEPFGLHGALIGVLLLTVLLTELMTNNAAAALAFPIALGIAKTLDVSYLPFVMAVIYGASASFLTPYGYQTNLMVMTPGSYTLGDYLRAGAPVSLVYVLGAAILIPLVFPFR